LHTAVCYLISIFDEVFKQKLQDKIREILHFYNEQSRFEDMIHLINNINNSSGRGDCRFDWDADFTEHLSDGLQRLKKICKGLEGLAAMSL